MAKKNIQTKSKDQVFREKAATYPVCFNEQCGQRDTCLHRVLRDYLPADTLILRCINPRNTEVAAGQCPMYRHSKPIRMPAGLSSIYYNMPGRMERAIKNWLIHKFSRKRYYEYHNGIRPMTPEVEQYVRQTLRDYGWQQEPKFSTYVEEYIW